MKDELILRWLEALESGKYEQGFGRLRSRNKFCPLGVLADIYDDTRWYNDKYDGQMTYLPEYIKMHRWDQVEIVLLNDENKLSFRQIVKIIKENRNEVSIKNT